MQARLGDRLTVHHDDGDPDAFYDFWDDFAEPRNIRVYCCGPKPLMEEVRAVSGHWPEGRVQFEDFKPVEAVRPDDRPFEVVLQRSGRTVAVPADLPILEALRAAGIAAPSSCESGVCGTCKTGLIAGEADHRDRVLMDEERAGYIMLCVSRARRAERSPLTSDPVRLGIVGLGRAFALTAPALRADRRIELVAACAPRAESRAAFEAEFGGRGYAALGEFLAHPGLEAVYIATPHGLHAAQVVATAAAGKHVLVEKPLAVSLADGDAMVDGLRSAPASP